MQVIKVDMILIMPNTAMNGLMPMTVTRVT